MLLSTDTRLREAINRLQTNDLAGAESLLQQMITENPNDGAAFQYLGIARSQRGDVAGGLIALREATRLMPMNAGVLYNLGIALAQSKQVDEARAALEKALFLDPNNANVRAALERLGYAPQPAPTAQPAPAAVPIRPVAGLDMGFASPAMPPAPTVPPVTPPTPTTLPPAPPMTGPAMLGTVGGGVPTLGTFGGDTGQSVAAPATPPPIPSTPIAPPPSARPGYPTAPAMPMSFQTPGGLSATDLSPVNAGYVANLHGGREPTSGERIQRGLLWGALLAQWWSLGAIAGRFLRVTTQLGFDGGEFAIFSLIVIVFFAVLGGVVGLILGSMNADDSFAGGVGIGLGILVGIVEFLVNPLIVWFLPMRAGYWFVTGRSFGTALGEKIQERIE